MTKPIKAYLIGNRIFTEASNEARELWNTSRFGSLAIEGKVELSWIEAIYLLEKGKIILLDGKGKEISFDKAFAKASKALGKEFWVRYVTYKNLRNRGYIVKTALKFGAEFRVYDKGVKPGEDHAKWIVYPVYESDKFTWYEFAAKNRVAHSTKKKLLIGTVDEEGDVTFWEVNWLRP